MHPVIRIGSALALSLGSASAFAQARVHSVSYDLASGTMIITGEDLKGSGSTAVKLGNAALSVLSATTTTVTAQLPANQAAGEYWLFVKRTKGLVEADSIGEAHFSMTIEQTPEPGPEGPQGETGAAGADGVSGHEIVTVASASDSSATKVVTASCPAGKSVIGGGHFLLPYNQATYRGIAVGASRPVNGNSWNAVGIELASTFTPSWQLSAYAICATVNP